MTNRREEFLSDLQEVLVRHRVTLSADDHFQGYAECGEDIYITAEFDWDINDEETPPEDINLGQTIWADDEIFNLGDLR